MGAEGHDKNPLTLQDSASTRRKGGSGTETKTGTGSQIRLSKLAPVAREESWLGQGREEQSRRLVVWEQRMKRRVSEMPRWKSCRALVPRRLRRSWAPAGASHTPKMTLSASAALVCRPPWASSVASCHLHLPFHSIPRTLKPLAVRPRPLRPNIASPLQPFTSTLSIPIPFNLLPPVPWLMRFFSWSAELHIPTTATSSGSHVIANDPFLLPFSRQSAR